MTPYPVRPFRDKTVHVLFRWLGFQFGRIGDGWTFRLGASFTVDMAPTLDFDYAGLTLYLGLWECFVGRIDDD